MHQLADPSPPWAENMTFMGTASTLRMNASSPVGWACAPSTRKALVPYA